MTEFRTRIGRVRLKGGADLHVLHNTYPDTLNDRRENWRGKLVEHARSIAADMDDLDGYIVIGLFANGSSCTAFRIPERIPSSLLPAYIAEMLRRDTVVHEEAARTFDSKFEWRE